MENKSPIDEIIDRMIEVAESEDEHMAEAHDNSLKFLQSYFENQGLMEAAQLANPGVDMAAEIHSALDNAVEVRSLVLRIIAAKADGDADKVDCLKARLSILIEL